MKKVWNAPGVQELTIQSTAWYGDKRPNGGGNKPNGGGNHFGGGNSNICQCQGGTSPCQNHDHDWEDETSSL